MPRKRERLSRQGWAGDELVPINGEVLKARLDERQWSQSELARRVGSRFTNQQNISHILGSGPQRRCRRNLRRRIAKVLEVPEESLANEPVVPAIGLMLWPGTEYRYSARTELAASRLLTLAARAVTRDLNRNLAQQEGPVCPPPNDVLEQALNWIADLVLIKHWRQKLIRWNPGVEAERGYTEPPTRNAWDVTVKGRRKPPRKERSRFPKGALLLDYEPLVPKPPEDPAHEAAVLGLLSSVEHLLRPWFDDEAELNYAGLRDFAHLPHHPFAERPEPHPATSPFAVFPPQSFAAPETQPSTQSTTNKLSAYPHGRDPSEGSS